MIPSIDQSHQNRALKRGSLLALVLSLLFLLSMGAFDAATASAADGTIIATKGGDRSASSANAGSTTYADPVAGATFEYTTGNPTLPATVWTAFPSATGVNGQASATVPPGTYYVRERSGGPGTSNYGPVQTLRWGGASNPPEQPYVARVSVVSGQTTYAYPHTNNNATPSNWTPFNGPSGSNNGSPFINVRDNQAAISGCGQNLLLVLDRSGSIQPYESEYANAAKQFVEHLNGTPTQIGIISFNDSVNSYQPAVGNSSYYRAPQDMSNPGSAALLYSTIDSIYSGTNGSTNWDGALNAASQAKSYTPNGLTGQTANPDQVVFLTDGNPTVNDTDEGGFGSIVSLFDLTAGMASANKVKSQTARPGTKLKMLAIGVGSGATIENLKTVSGPIEGIGGDYANPTIAELEAALDEFAATQCGARVYIRKHLTTDATNQAGWKYTATDPRPGFTPSYLDNNPATHASGTPPVIETAAFFQNLPAGTTTMKIAEDASGQPFPSFDLIDITCRADDYDSGAVVPGTRTGLEYSLDLSEGEDVYCTFTNKPKSTLTVNKTPDNQTINAGEDAVFTIGVTNTGQAPTTNTTLSDTLPAPGVGGWSIVSQPGGNPCTIVGNLLSCAFGTLAPGDSPSVVVKTGTSYAACGVYDNPSASATADNTTSATDAGKITCIKPSLSVNKTGNGPVNAGQDIEYTMVTSNGGPGVAKAVTLSDTLPSGTAGGWVVDTQPAGNPCSITGNLLSCSFGDLASGASKTVKVKAATSFANCIVYNNSVTASATNAPDAGSGASITCDKPALSVSKTGNGPVSAGEDIEFTIQVGNAGPGKATSVTLDDPLPSGTAGPWTISSQPLGDPCSITGNQMDCNFGDLAAGASVTVKVKAPTDYANCTEYDNHVVASATNAPNESTNGFIACQKPDLSVSKTGNGPINAGEDVAFTIVTSNGGPGTAKSVTLSDPLPSGTAGAWVIDTQPAGNPCSIVANTLSCSFGDIAEGLSKTVTVKAPTNAAACTVYNNTATASSSNGPGASQGAVVNCNKPDLVVTKTGNGPVNAGEHVEFAITVGNNGPGTAKAVTLSDPLPSGTAGGWSIESQPGGNPCSIAANTLNCSFGDLVQGESVTVDVDAATDFDNCKVYDNTATASSANAPDKTASDSVNCLKPSLLINKTGNGTVKAGQDVVFTMVINSNGPGTAHSVTVNDSLPSGVAGPWTISSQPAGDLCSITGKSLNCNFGDLAAGATVTIKVKAPTSDSKCETYNNTATAAALNNPVVASKDTVTCEVPPPPKPVIRLKKTADRKKVAPGDTVQYAVWVRNIQKGSVAEDVKICDRLPDRMTIVSKGQGQFENGRLCWNVKKLEYTSGWVTHFHYRARVNEGVNAGAKLKNVVTSGNQSASHTVTVKEPQNVSPAGGGGGRTPVTG